MQNDTFKVAMDKLYKEEGGISDVDGDPGGYTYKGISQVYNPSWAGWQYVKSKDFNKANELVKDFYYNEYWLPLQCDKIKNPKIAILFFQIAVNIYTITAIKYMQWTVGVYPDGILGPMTINAINNYHDHAELELIFRAIVARHYLNRVDSDAKQRKFLYGWLKRACLVDTI